MLISDTHDPEWRHTVAEEKWVAAQGLDPRCVWRYEIYQLDTLCALMYQYVRDERGLIKWDEIKDEVMTASRMIAVSSMPPRS